VRFEAAHLHMYATAAPHALNDIAYTSRCILRDRMLRRGKLVGSLESQDIPQVTIRHIVSVSLALL
jgi:hypothetical protein